MNKTHVHNQTNRYTKMYYKSTAQKCMPLSNAWATLFMELSHSRNPFAARIICVLSECLCHFLRLLRCCCCFNLVSGLRIAYIRIFCVFFSFLCLAKYICDLHTLLIILFLLSDKTNVFESIFGGCFSCMRKFHVSCIFYAINDNNIWSCRWRRHILKWRQSFYNPFRQDIRKRSPKIIFTNKFLINNDFHVITLECSFLNWIRIYKMWQLTSPKPQWKSHLFRLQIFPSIIKKQHTFPKKDNIFLKIMSNMHTFIITAAVVSLSVPTFNYRITDLRVVCVFCLDSF